MQVTLSKRHIQILIVATLAIFSVLMVRFLWPKPAQQQHATQAAGVAAHKDTGARPVVFLNVQSNVTVERGEDTWASQFSTKLATALNAAGFDVQDRADPKVSYRMNLDLDFINKDKSLTLAIGKTSSILVPGQRSHVLITPGSIRITAFPAVTIDVVSTPNEQQMQDYRATLIDNLVSSFVTMLQKARNEKT